MNVFNILDNGADASGNALSTDAIRKAVDECAENGGEVVVPVGTFLTGDILLRDNVTLHLLTGAKLLGSRNPADYFNYRKYVALAAEDISDAPWSREAAGETDTSVRSHVVISGSRWNNALIRAFNAKNIAVIGDEGSVIDGNDVYDEYGEEYYRGPHGMTFFGCENVKLHGYTIRNTGNWAHNIHDCTNVSFDSITVLAGHDGIHLCNNENVVIKNSGFYTGDDSIAGFANANVLVANCKVNSACSAFRFGGTNVLVRDCHIFAPARYCFRGVMSPEDKKNSTPSFTREQAEAKGLRTNMLSLFTYYSDFSLKIPEKPGNVVIRDCKIEGADRFLHFNYSGNELWQANRPLTGITFENIEATDISMPLTAYGDKNDKITVKLKNVSVKIRKGSEMTAFMHLCNYDELKVDGLHLEGFEGDALVRSWSPDDSADIKNVSGDVPSVLVKAADKPFYAKPI